MINDMIRPLLMPANTIAPFAQRDSPRSSRFFPTPCYPLFREVGMKSEKELSLSADVAQGSLAFRKSRTRYHGRGKPEGWRILIWRLSRLSAI